MLNYRKYSFWILALLILVVIIGNVLVINLKRLDRIQLEEVASEEVKPEEVTSEELSSESSLSVSDTVYHTEYNRVNIEFLSDIMGFNSENEFEATEIKAVAYIDSMIRSSQTPIKNDDLDNNHTKQYRIKLSNDIGGYSCELYYDTLYNEACLIKDGGQYKVGTDFARYIDSFLENRNINFHIDDKDVVKLFQTYGWTLDYEINAVNDKLNNINVLMAFNPNAYYYAYNNELSKDIGLDMSRYSNTDDIEVEIYGINESMPEEFFPSQNCRGIVVKKDEKIIGAFLSAGRHSAFNACSLKGNSFEKVTGETLDQWLADMIKADSNEDRLSKLNAEEVICEYFTALENKDAKAAEYCISKKSLMENLTVNMSNDKLFNEGIGLPLAGASMEDKSSFDNLKSVKLLKIDLIKETSETTKTFKVTMNLQYNKDQSLSRGEQFWDCYMIFESPQTGWKIEGFGH